MDAFFVENVSLLIPVDQLSNIFQPFTGGEDFVANPLDSERSILHVTDVRDQSIRKANPELGNCENSTGLSDASHSAVAPTVDEIQVKNPLPSDTVEVRQIFSHCHVSSRGRCTAADLVLPWLANSDHRCY